MMKTKWPFLNETFKKLLLDSNTLKVMTANVLM